MKKDKGKKNNKKTKQPIYYGLHLEIETERKLLQLIQNSMELILSQYKEDFNQTYDTIIELIKKFDEAKEGNEDNNKQNKTIEVNKMKYPKSFHITTLFGGRKGFDEKSEAYKEFSQGKEVGIKPLGVVIVPNKMVIIPLTAECSIDNQFPHLTTFIGELKPVQSNEILESLFDDKMSLNEEYNNVLEGKEGEYIKKTTIKIDGSDADAFVYLNSKNEKFLGRMKGYFF